MLDCVVDLFLRPYPLKNATRRAAGCSFGAVLTLSSVVTIEGYHE